MSEAQETRNHHVVNMTDCSRLSLCGVKEVLSFDDGLVVLSTLCGILTIDGENLHISRLNLDIGECELAGNITGIYYSKARERVGLFSRRAKRDAC